MAVGSDTVMSSVWWWIVSVGFVWGVRDSSGVSGVDGADGVSCCVGVEGAFEGVAVNVVGILFGVVGDVGDFGAVISSIVEVVVACINALMVEVLFGKFLSEDVVVGKAVGLGVMRLVIVGVLFAVGMVLITSVGVGTPFITPFTTSVTIVVVVRPARVEAEELSCW